MKRIFYALAVLVCMMAMVSSCEETVNDNDEYANWKSRNEAAFDTCMNTAKREIAAARATYGDNWQEHCRWRILTSYLVPNSAVPQKADSMCVEIIESGNGSGSPLYTDSVRVNYYGRAIPTASYPEGFMFDHSGLSSKVEDIFDAAYARPSTFYVGNVVVGFTTALQQMRIGDRWKLYLPWQLAYGSQSPMTRVPAYSMLTFEVQLKAYYRAGVVPPAWH